MNLVLSSYLPHIFLTIFLYIQANNIKRILYFGGKSMKKTAIIIMIAAIALVSLTAGGQEETAPCRSVLMDRR